MRVVPTILLRHLTLTVTVAAVLAAGTLAAGGAALAVALRPAAARLAAIRLDSRAAAAYAGGDGLIRSVPELTVPAGQRVTGPAQAAAAGRAFAAMAAALPGVRLADYATTHDRVFIAPGGRSTWALLYAPPGSSPASAPAIQRALVAAAPRGWQARLAQWPLAAPFGPFGRLGPPGPWPSWRIGACGPARPAPGGQTAPCGPSWAGRSRW
jgi:hypothetical protein